MVEFGIVVDWCQVGLVVVVYVVEVYRWGDGQVVVGDCVLDVEVLCVLFVGWYECWLQLVVVVVWGFVGFVWYVYEDVVFVFVQCCVQGQFVLQCFGIEMVGVVQFQDFVLVFGMYLFVIGGELVEGGVFVMVELFGVGVGIVQLQVDLGVVQWMVVVFVGLGGVGGIVVGQQVGQVQFVVVVVDGLLVWWGWVVVGGEWCLV